MKVRLMKKFNGQSKMFKRFNQSSKSSQKGDSSKASKRREFGGLMSDISIRAKLSTRRDEPALIGVKSKSFGMKLF